MRQVVSSSLWLIIIALGLTSCENYGTKLSKDYVEVYYKDGIKKENAQQTLDLLYPSWNDSGNTKSIQLTKTGDTVNFRMVIDEEKAKHIKDDAYFALANEVSSSIFKGSPVNVDLTTNSFKTIRTLRFQEIKTADYGKKYSAGNIEVYGNDEGTNEQALAAFLDRLDGNAVAVKSFQLSKDNDIYLVNMVSDPGQSSLLPEKEFQELASVISDSVFNGAPITLQLTDTRFEPYKAFKYKHD